MEILVPEVGTTGYAAYATVMSFLHNVFAMYFIYYCNSLTINEILIK